eukprot:1146116-Pelagomonas_calceolata.AAC.4
MLLRACGHIDEGRLSFISVHMLAYRSRQGSPLMRIVLSACLHIDDGKSSKAARCSSWGPQVGMAEKRSVAQELGHQHV